MLKQSVIYHRLKQFSCKFNILRNKRRISYKTQSIIDDLNQNPMYEYKKNPKKIYSNYNRITDEVIKSGIKYYNSFFYLSKKESNTKYILVILIFILILTRLIIPTYIEIILSVPIGEMIMILLGLVGFWKNNDILKGLIIVGIIDSFILGAFGFILGNLWSIIYVIGIIEGSICFLMKPLRDWRTAFLDVWIYLVISLLAAFNSPLKMLSEYNSFLFAFTNLLILIMPFFMAYFVYLKNMEHLSQPQMNSKGYSKFDLFMIERIPQHKIHKWEIIFTIGLHLIFMIISIYISHKVISFITISSWSFTICVISYIFRNNSYNSWIVSVSFPMMWLALFNYESPTTWVEFFNILFHFFIIATGIYILSVNRNIRWDYFTTVGFSILLYGFGLNYFIPGYLGIYTIEMIYFIIGCFILLSIMSYRWNIDGKEYLYSYEEFQNYNLIVT